MNKTPFHFSSVIFLFTFLSFCSCSYLPAPYDESEGLIIEEYADFIVLRPDFLDQSKAGMLFYPGGLVDPHAYIDAFDEIVLLDKRIVLILKVTSNLAILNSQKASAVTVDFPEINRWVVGGHSLGGSSACIDAFNNEESFVGLFLLASYSVSDLSDRNMPMISITGSEDAVLDLEKFQENKVNLTVEVSIASSSEIPLNGTSGTTIYYEIGGGNHAQFGSYGAQEGDGSADISSEEQQSRVVAALQAFFISNGL